jgi:trehalose-6-phosphate synthase
MRLTFLAKSLDDRIDKDTEQKAWKAYEAANKSYAQAIIDVYQPGDLIWIHDYHLSKFCGPISLPKVKAL